MMGAEVASDKLAPHGFSGTAPRKLAVSFACEGQRERANAAQRAAWPRRDSSGLNELGSLSPLSIAEITLPKPHINRQGCPQLVPAGGAPASPASRKPSRSPQRERRHRAQAGKSETGSQNGTGETSQQRHHSAAPRCGRSRSASLQEEPALCHPGGGQRFPSSVGGFEVQTKRRASSLCAGRGGKDSFGPPLSKVQPLSAHTNTPTNTNTPRGIFFKRANNRLALGRNVMTIFGQDLKKEERAALETFWSTEPPLPPPVPPLVLFFARKAQPSP